jgi:hypothetical protein
MLLSGLLIFQQCNRNEVTPRTIPLGTETRVGLLETVIFTENSEGNPSASMLNATLLKVDDSRCPSGAICVWAGEAVVTFRITSGDSTAEVTLSDCKNCPVVSGRGSNPASFSLNGHTYRLSLVEVTPYPKLNQQKKIDYKATIQITRL